MNSNQTAPTSASLHSTTSYSSLASTAKPDSDPTTTTSPQGRQDENNKTDSTTPAREVPQDYVYYERKGPPNPNAQPKQKSRLSKFLEKFQSPVVQQANAARERKQLEEERTGIRTYRPAGAPSDSKQSTWAFM
ncbi:hypothetical protein P885DRAFT_81724 [Corynascus similis CBS 632.67]